jgi:hypothetical protein
VLGWVSSAHGGELDYGLRGRDCSFGLFVVCGDVLDSAQEEDLSVYEDQRNLADHSRYQAAK